MTREEWMAEFKRLQKERDDALAAYEEAARIALELGRVVDQKLEALNAFYTKTTFETAPPTLDHERRTEK